MPGSPGELTKCLREILADWHIELLLPSFDILPSASHFSDFNATAVLCRLRAEQMEYVLSVSYCEEQSSCRYHFYKSLLRAESRWLKSLLKERISLLHSDRDARLLLCQVLDEVYDTGVRVDDACRQGFSAELCGQLKGALASLYLELTIDFGHLLEPTDYMDYRYLLSDAHYLHPIRESERLKYDILQAENQVKRLVCTGATEERGTAALLLYDKLLGLHVSLNLPTQSDAGLWQGMVVLENFLFLFFNEVLPDEKDLYSHLLDKEWSDACLVDFCTWRYARHLQYAEGRGASQWIFKKLNERCFGFLSPLVTCEVSLPRLVRSYLLQKQELYEQNYSRAFIPIQSGEKLSIASSRSLGAKLPDEGEIHSLLAFLLNGTDANGVSLMLPEHVQWLEEAFFSFLQSGQIGVIHKNGVKILKGYAEVLYGLFFHYQQLRGGDRMEYAVFLATILDVDVQPKNLVSNCKRCMDAYEAFVNKTKLHFAG